MMAKSKERYYNHNCEFYDDCFNGEDVGGEGGCYSCVHNLEEENQ